MSAKSPFLQEPKEEDFCKEPSKALYFLKKSKKSRFKRSTAHFPKLLPTLGLGERFRWRWQKVDAGHSLHRSTRRPLAAPRDSHTTLYTAQSQRKTRVPESNPVRRQRTFTYICNFKDERVWNTLGLLLGNALLATFFWIHSVPFVEKPFLPRNHLFADCFSPRFPAISVLRVMKTNVVLFYTISLHLHFFK